MKSMPGVVAALIVVSSIGFVRGDILDPNAPPEGTLSSTMAVARPANIPSLMVDSRFDLSTGSVTDSDPPLALLRVSNRGGSKGGPFRLAGFQKAESDRVNATAANDSPLPAPLGNAPIIPVTEPAHPIGLLCALGAMGLIWTRRRRSPPR